VGSELAGNDRFRRASPGFDDAGSRYLGASLLRHAWTFTDDDIQAFRDELKKRSLGIASHWQHEDGIAFIVADGRD